MNVHYLAVSHNAIVSRGPKTALQQEKLLPT
jgi:hypothetical protein